MTDVKPPKNVNAIRVGNKAAVTWERVPMTEDDDCISYSFTDEAGCSQPSGGKIAAAKKHGCTDWATIPWSVP